MKLVLGRDGPDGALTILELGIDLDDYRQQGRFAGRNPIDDLLAAALSAATGFEHERDDCLAAARAIYAGIRAIEHDSRWQT